MKRYMITWLHGKGIRGLAGKASQTRAKGVKRRAGTEPWLTFARLCSGLLAFARLLPGTFFSADGKEGRDSNKAFYFSGFLTNICSRSSQIA
jgi:hypothetical protein